MIVQASPACQTTLTTPRAAFYTPCESRCAMNLLCVIDNLGTGGAQRQILNLAVGLHRRGHEVSLYCYTPGALLAHYLEKEGLRLKVELKRSRFSLDVIGNL